MKNDINKKIQAFRTAKDLININKSTPGHSEALSALPHTDLQNEVYSVYKSVFINENIDIDSDFFKIGGNSLKAVQIAGRLNKLGYDVKVHDLFIHTTIAKLSAFLFFNEKKDDLVAVSTGKKENYDLSDAQKRFWILNKFEGGSKAYNISLAYYLDGDLNTNALEKAIYTLISRHEILRTVFIEKDGEPKQKILEPDDHNFQVRYIDFKGKNYNDTKLEEVIFRQSQCVFDFVNGPLFEVTLIKLDDHQFIIIVVFHHIITDGWSIGVFGQEITLLYKKFSKQTEEHLDDLQFQYRDYINLDLTQKNQENFILSKNYWLDKFKNKVSTNKIPTDYSRPDIRSFRGGSLLLNIPSDIIADIKVFQKLNEATSFMVFLATLKILLYKNTSQENISIGTVVSGRDLPVLQQQIGPYVNTLVMNTTVAKEDTVQSFISKVKATVIEAFKYQKYSYYDLISDLGLSRNFNYAPFLDIMLIMQNTLSANLDLEGISELKITELSFQTHISRFDLSFQVQESPDKTIVRIHYNTDLYKHARIEIFGEEFLSLLQLLVKNEKTKVADLEVMSNLEKSFNSDFNNLQQFDFNF